MSRSNFFYGIRNKLAGGLPDGKLSTLLLDNFSTRDEALPTRRNSMQALFLANLI